MQETIIGVQKILNDLKSERKLVFASFSKNPSNIRLAVEIKVLDDRISDLDIALSEHRNSDGGARGPDTRFSEGVKILQCRDE